MSTGHQLKGVAQAAMMIAVHLEHGVAILDALTIDEIDRLAARVGLDPNEARFAIPIVRDMVAESAKAHAGTAVPEGGR